MPFLCGVPVPGRGVLDSNLIHSGGKGIKSNLIPHVFCPGTEGGLDSNLISRRFRV